MVQPLTEFFGKFSEDAGAYFTGLWDGIVAVWETVSGWFDENVVQPVEGFFSGMWDGLKNGATDAWDGIKNAFGVVATWFEETFQGAWQGVKDVFSTGGRIFEGIKEGIEDTFKNVVNAIIRGINKVITIPFGAINDMLNTLRSVDIFGVRPFEWMATFDIPQIPELALGGIISSPRLIMAGEEGSEAIVPLEKNTGWIRQVAAELAEEHGSGETTEIVDMLKELSELISRIRVVLDSGEVVGGILDQIDSRLGINAGYAERGVAMA